MNKFYEEVINLLCQKINILTAIILPMQILPLGRHPAHIRRHRGRILNHVLRTRHALRRGQILNHVLRARHALLRTHPRILRILRSLRAHTRSLRAHHVRIQNRSLAPIPSRL